WGARSAMAAHDGYSYWPPLGRAPAGRFRHPVEDDLRVCALRHYGDTVDRPGWLAGLRDRYVATARRRPRRHRPPLDPDRPRPHRRPVAGGVRGALHQARGCAGDALPARLRMQRAQDPAAGPADHGWPPFASLVGYQSDVAFAAAFKARGRPPTRHLPTPAPVSAGVSSRSGHPAAERNTGL